MRVVCLNQDPGIHPRRRKGAAVHLMAMREAFAELGAEVVSIDESDEAALEALRTAHARAPIDLLYERYALGKPAAARFCSAHGVPLVVEMNAPLADEEARYRAAVIDPAAAERDRELLGAAALVLAVSTEVASYAVERGADARLVCVRANGVDARRFRPRSAADAVRARLVPAQRFALGFHGRLRDWHGFELFSRAAQRLLELGEDVHLVLVGEGDFERHLADRVAAQRVTRVAWVEHAEIGPYVASFDALPLTYAPDVPCYFSPLKLAEAMACGVVPVLPRLGNLARAATDGVDALYYRAGDVDELVSTVRLLIHDTPLRERLARAARASAAERSWQSIATFVLSSVALRAGA